MSEGDVGKVAVPSVEMSGTDFHGEWSSGYWSEDDSLGFTSRNSGSTEGDEMYSRAKSNHCHFAIKMADDRVFVAKVVPEVVGRVSD